MALFLITWGVSNEQWCWANWNIVDFELQSVQSSNLSSEGCMYACLSYDKLWLYFHVQRDGTGTTCHFTAEAVCVLKAVRSGVLTH